MKQTVDISIQTPTSLAASFTGIPVEVSRFTALSIQLVFDYTGGATSSGVISVEQSNNGVNWSQSPSSTQSVNNTNSNLVWNLPRITSRYIRISYTYSSGSGGTCATIAHATL